MIMTSLVSSNDVIIYFCVDDITIPTGVLRAIPVQMWVGGFFWVTNIDFFWGGRRKLVVV